jgi:hypothetical protein
MSERAKLRRSARRNGLYGLKKLDKQTVTIHDA